MTTAIDIHPLHADELEAAARLFDAYRRFYEQPADLARARGFLTERLSRGDAVILVAAQAGELRGLCQLYPLFDSIQAAPIYLLSDLYVAPEARRSGIARQLMRAAEQRALADGCVGLELTTAHTNRPAQALYESLGWVQDTVYRTYTRAVGPAG